MNFFYDFNVFHHAFECSKRKDVNQQLGDLKFILILFLDWKVGELSYLLAAFVFQVSVGPPDPLYLQHVLILVFIEEKALNGKLLQILLVQILVPKDLRGAKKYIRQGEHMRETWASVVLVHRQGLLGQLFEELEVCIARIQSCSFNLNDAVLSDVDENFVPQVLVLLVGVQDVLHLSVVELFVL